MMQVRNTHDLKIAYEILNIHKEYISECKEPETEQKKEKIIEQIIELKREIRRFHKKTNDRRIVKDYGIDGVVELVELPDSLKDVETATEYFEECEVRYALPSIYDCTGQAFTSWFKIFKRHNRLFAYHSVSFDV